MQISSINDLTLRKAGDSALSSDLCMLFFPSLHVPKCVSEKIVSAEPETFGRKKMC
jgi:hypothetical protein